MTPAIYVSMVLAVISLCSLYIAWHQHRLNNSDRISASLRATILAVVNEALQPVKDLLNSHTARLTQHSERALRTEDVVKENSKYIRDLSDKLTQQGVKVDMYWTTLEQLAMNAAKGLHQPDPRRARVDHLLEAFIEGTLTPEERTELKKILVQIRNYEDGITVLDFPVQQGEQTFAAILLSTMDAVDPRRMQAMGHNLHRAARDKENKNGYSG